MGAAHARKKKKKKAKLVCVEAKAQSTRTMQLGGGASNKVALMTSLALVLASPVLADTKASELLFQRSLVKRIATFLAWTVFKWPVLSLHCLKPELPHPAPHTFSF